MRAEKRTSAQEGMGAEKGILTQFKKEGLSPQRWSNGPGAVYEVHDHPYHKVLYVVQGSIEFELPGEGRSVRMSPGDRLDLKAHTPHSAVVGPEGVVCLEGHRP